jgi:hypothetical protein
MHWLRGNEYFEIFQLPTGVIPAGSSITVLIRPKTGLPIGNYSGVNGGSIQIIPSGGNPYSRNIALSFSVSEPTPSAITDYESLKVECANQTGDTLVKLTQNISDINKGTTQLTVGRNLTLDLAGYNLEIELPAATGNNSNGIKINPGVTLTVICSVGTGKLDVANNADSDVQFGFGAAINTTEGTIIIQSGVVNATGGMRGAGIGGGQSGAQDGRGGNITINGGTITATGGEFGAGIGGGGRVGGGWVGAGGNITITGGNVTATGGRDASGMGGGNGAPGDNIIISGGTVTAVGNSRGSGIGGGGASNAGVGGVINISGGTVKATGGGSGGAGIGSGSSATGGNITISGGSVTASGNFGAGIGGGGSPLSNTIGIINISGGTIIATSRHGAGIGGGRNDNGGEINISSGSVTATSEFSAGIGAGSLGNNGGAITISGDAYVIATGGNFGAGIGGGEFGAGGNITINGGTVIATAGNNNISAMGPGINGSGGTVTVTGEYFYWLNVIASGPGGSPNNDTFNNDTTTFAPNKNFSFIKLTQLAQKTVSVGAQNGSLVAGAAETVTFPVTTTTMDNGNYNVAVHNLPTGVSVQGQVAISDNVGTLTLAGSTSTIAGTSNNLTLTLDGVTSTEFTLTITESGSSNTDYKKVISEALTELLPSANINLTVEKEMIKGIPPSVAVSTLASLSDVAAIRNANGTSRTTGNIGTGTLIVFTNGTELIAVVYGDGDGDGSVNSNDVVVLRMYLAGMQIAGQPVNRDIDIDAFRAAFDVDGNELVNSNDVVLLRMSLAGMQIAGKPIILGPQP